MANTIIEKEMLAQFVEQKLIDAVKLMPLAKVENVDAEAGHVIRVPQTAYIGDAKKVAAGQPIDLEFITQTSVMCEVGKLAKGMTFTVEDLNNAYMDIQGEAEQQMLKAIANGIEKDLFGELAKTNLEVTIDALTVDGLADAVVPFGEDIEEPMYLLVNPADFASLRKDDSFVMNANHNAGEVKSAGNIFNMEVVVSNRVEAKKPFIVKQDAVALYIKKDVEIEEDKDIVKQVVNLVATQHYATMLHDATKVIKVTVGA